MVPGLFCDSARKEFQRGRERARCIDADLVSFCGTLLRVIIKVWPVQVLATNSFQPVEDGVATS